MGEVVATNIYCTFDNLLLSLAFSLTTFQYDPSIILTVGRKALSFIGGIEQGYVVGSKNSTQVGVEINNVRGSRQHELYYYMAFLI